jgi:hypothetical protein
MEKNFIMNDRAYFNEPNVDLNDLSLFPADIYERTKGNPNSKVSSECEKNTKSLDDYAKRVAREMITSIKG